MAPSLPQASARPPGERSGTPVPSHFAGCCSSRPDPRDEKETPSVAVKIRLMRVGKKKQPTYRVVVADGRSPRDGRFIEIIGQYAPRQDPSFCQIDADSALAWLRKGAQPTEQVQKLLTAQGVWAQYESERGKPADTKLSRRGYATGKVKPPEKQVKEAPSRADARGGGCRGRGSRPPRRPPRGARRRGRPRRGRPPPRSRQTTTADERRATTTPTTTSTTTSRTRSAPRATASPVPARSPSPSTSPATSPTTPMPSRSTSRSAATRSR